MNIKEIINLSQELNSKLWDLLSSGDDNNIGKAMQIYRDASQLDVMSNLEIDSAKKENPADNVAELQIIKERYDNRVDKRNEKYERPMFFKYLDKEKGFYNPKRKKYRYYNTAMDYLQEHINNVNILKTDMGDFIPFSEVLVEPDKDSPRIDYSKVEKVIEMVKNLKSENTDIYSNNALSNFEKHEQSNELRKSCADKISNMFFNDKTIYYLLKQIEDEENSKVARLLFYMLFAKPNESFYKFVLKSKEKLEVLKEDEKGRLRLYDFKFKKV